jgi:hypothetical protein
MPTLTQCKLPVPKSWDEFEDIVVSAINSLQPITQPQRFGRQGQAQHGVDILVDDYMSRRTGIQCKNVDKISLPEIEAEIAKAERYEPSLESYVFAVSLSRDAKLHKQISMLSDNRAREYKFRVGIWFWEDIEFFMSRHSVELERHYPDLFTSSSSPTALLDSIQTDVANQRLKALQEMWALRHRILPPKRFPDMEWYDVLEDISLDLNKHADGLRDINQRLGSTLPKEVSALLGSAEAAAIDGSFEVSLVEDFEVPYEACQAAERMLELLTDAIDKTRTSLVEIGVRLD